MKTSRSQEFKDKIAASRRGTKHSEAAKAKIGAKSKGRRHTIETRAKISQSLIGHSPWNKGRSMTSDEIQRHSEIRRGKIPWNKGKTGLGGYKWTEEQRARFRARLGKPDMQEQRRRIGQQLYPLKRARFRRTGPRTIEERARISASLMGHPPANVGNSGRGQGGVYAGVWMRSSYERRFAAAMERFGVRWVYEPVAFRLPNLSAYHPDFLLCDLGVYVEVKGYLAPKSAVKLQAFQATYSHERLMFVFLAELQALERAACFSLDLLRPQLYEAREVAS